MLNAKITGIASYIPDDILDNEMLSRMVDTNDDASVSRSVASSRSLSARPTWASRP